MCPCCPSLSVAVVALIALNGPASPVDHALAALCEDGTELACVSRAIGLDAAHNRKPPSAKVLTTLEDTSDQAVVVVRGLHYLRFKRLEPAAEAFASACEQDLSACAWRVAVAKRSQKGDVAALTSAAEARCAETDGAPCAKLKPLFAAGDGTAVAKIMAAHYSASCRTAGTYGTATTTWWWRWTYWTANGRWTPTWSTSICRWSARR